MTTTRTRVEYDLQGVRRELGRSRWLEVLRVFAHVKLATVAQIHQATGISEKTIAGILAQMETVRQKPGMPDDEEEADIEVTDEVRRAETAAGHDMSYITWNDDEKTEEEQARAKAHATKLEQRRVVRLHPDRIEHRAMFGVGAKAKVYKLGTLGQALLVADGQLGRVRQTMGLTNSEAIKHSLCILDIVIEAQKQKIADAKAECVLHNAVGDELRADVAVPVPDKQKQWRMIEVEQTINDRNRWRPGNRLLALQKFFSGKQGNEPVVPELLILFNLKMGDLPKTLEYWQTGLGDVRDPEGKVPFKLRYALLHQWLEDPEWSDWSKYREVEPKERPPEVVVDKINPRAWLDADVTKPADLTGLATTVHSLASLSRSMPDLGSGKNNLDVPTKSLRALRAWLEAPGQFEMRGQLMTTLNAMDLRMSPPVMTMVLYHLYWDVVLRHWGLAEELWNQGNNNAEFMVVKVKADSAGGYKITAELKGLREGCLPGLPNEVGDANALNPNLSWFLSALFRYAYELGLRQDPWTVIDGWFSGGRKRGDGDEGRGSRDE